MLFALFFLLVGKEVLEHLTATNGKLRGRGALTPLIATVGGVVGPALVFYLVARLLQAEEIISGWAIPTATDIAFAALFSRIVFGSIKHPAVVFLMTLAIVDDIAGVIILGLFYQQRELHLEWLLLSFGSVLTAYVLFNWLPRWIDKRTRGRRHITDWVESNLGLKPYFALGALCWFGFQEAGIHPALGLLPIVFAMPHGNTDRGYFEEAVCPEDDEYLLDKLGRKISPFEGYVLFLFGLLSAGVALDAIGDATIAVLAGLLFGKLIGIYLFGILGDRLYGLPEGMSRRHLLIVGLLSSVGFTVSLFVADAAFMGMPDVLAEAKMGALISLVFGPVAILIARLLGTKPEKVLLKA